jgi:hypothetical protein
MFQIIIKYNHIFHSKALQNLPKLEFLVWKQTIWQLCFNSILKNEINENRRFCNAVNVKKKASWKTFRSQR